MSPFEENEECIEALDILLEEEETTRLFNEAVELDLRNKIANVLFGSGVKPKYSHGICGALTCGYGELDFNGYWQFPVSEKLFKED